MKEGNQMKLQFTFCHKQQTKIEISASTDNLRVLLLKRLMSKNQVPQGIHKQEQSPIISQGVEEQPQLAHFDDPCHELLHEVSILQGSSSNSWKVNGENQVVSKSFAVTAAHASNKCQQLNSTPSTSTLASTVTSDGNFDLLDEAPRAQEILMDHLSNYASDVISEVFDAISDQVAKCTFDNLKHKELDASLIAELESYKERAKQFED
uniref:Uncharacterized protein n=1 Tax=Tanacetum cinerariifolium TaxID=118510 RepID=A0A6L2L1X1_TANCI|nr:hypothetical protein [Tanacetum cinerariifolium]